MLLPLRREDPAFPPGRGPDLCILFFGPVAATRVRSRPDVLSGNCSQPCQTLPLLRQRLLRSAGIFGKTLPGRQAPARWRRGRSQACPPHCVFQNAFWQRPAARTVFPLTVRQRSVLHPGKDALPFPHDASERTALKTTKEPPGSPSQRLFRSRPASPGRINIRTLTAGVPARPSGRRQGSVPASCAYCTLRRNVPVTLFSCSRRS